MKVLTLVGTRPEIIRLSVVLPMLDETFQHLLVDSGQNFDPNLSHRFYKELSLREPDITLNKTKLSGENFLGHLFVEMAEIISTFQPDCVVLLGDTNSALASLVFKKHRIPIFHLEAGNRCWDQNVPEEVNRKVIDCLSDVNLCYSDEARENLLREGAAPDRTFVLGSPMLEVFDRYAESIANSSILERFGLVRDQFLVVSVHRAERIDTEAGIDSFIDLLTLLDVEMGLPIIVSTHPRTREKLRHSNEFVNVRFCEPFGYLDYMKLQTNSYAVISDSGTVIEESSICGFPAISFRGTYERQESMRAGAVVVTDDLHEILSCIESARNDVASARHRLVDSYSEKFVSKKLITLIRTYTRYVARTVYRS